jgi:ACR3 family arsenite transporter
MLRGSKFRAFLRILLFNGSRCARTNRRNSWPVFHFSVAADAGTAICFPGRSDYQARQPLVIAILAVPILIQVFFNSGLAYLLNRKLGVPHCVAGPSSLIGASNFFELAVATAISLFGLQPGAALAAVVGVLIEVPVMLLVVGVVNRSQQWYEATV